MKHVFSRGRPRTPPPSATRASTEPPEPRRLPVQPDARAAGRRRPRRPGELHRLHDAQAPHRHRLQHAAAEHRFYDRTSRHTTRASPTIRTAPTANVVENQGDGQFNALQVELNRRWRGGLAFNVAYTLRPLRHQGSGLGQQHARSSSSRTVGPTERPRARPEHGEAPRRRERDLGVPVGRTEPRREHARLGGRPFGGWTVSTIFQARSGLNLTPFFSGYYSTTPGTRPCPWTASATGSAAPGGRTWSATPTSAPRTTSGSTRRPMPSRGRAVREREERQPPRARHVGRQLLVLQGRRRDEPLPPAVPALLDNAFNHPQFFPGYGDSFTNMQSYLEDGDPNNGVTGVLGGDTIGNAEGFSTGRVIRLGIGATF